jgi:hypothetical protein
MQTARIASSILVGGIQFSSTVTRQATGEISHVPVLDAGVAGLVSATGVDGLPTGHGIIQTDVIDVHWTDSGDGTHKCCRGLTVDSATTNAIVFNDTPAHEGDAMPAEETPVVVSVQTVIETDWDGDLTKMIGCRCANRACVDFRSSSASIAATKLVAGEGWWWASDQSIANPLAGETVDTIRVSNGSTTEATFYFGVLYASV